MQDNQKPDDFTPPDSRSDYHPLLSNWKPLEQALRYACDVEADFYTDAATMINALKCILSTPEINALHQLRIYRNELVHKQKVTHFDHAGVKSTKFIQESARLAARLNSFSESERRSAHNALLSGQISTTAEEDAWRRLHQKLRDLTSQQSPYECINTLSKQAPRTLIDKLHQLRKTWAAISHEGLEKESFVSEINAILPLLSDRERLLADKIKEDAYTYWPGAGILAPELQKAWNLFADWFAGKGGSLDTFFESIEEIAKEEDALKEKLHKIRMLKNKIGNQQKPDTDATAELIAMIQSVAIRRNKTESLKENPIKIPKEKFTAETTCPNQHCSQKLRFKASSFDIWLRCPKCKIEFSPKQTVTVFC